MPGTTLYLRSVAGSFEREHRRRHGDIQRLGTSGVRDGDPHADRSVHIVPLVGEAGSLVAHDDGDPTAEVDIGVRRNGATISAVTARADESQSSIRDLVQVHHEHRNVEQRTG